MLILFVLILCHMATIESNHFNGGSITWFPVNPSTNSSPVVVTITQTYYWTYPLILCNVSVPASTGIPFYYTVNLTCVANCTTDGGYATAPVSIATDCISSSSSLGSMTSQRSVNISLAAGAHFTLAYRSLAWRSIRNTNASNPGWSMATLIDLQERSDGIINTPPVATIASPQYVLLNRTTLIKIPVTDLNENDDVRCRWAQATGSPTNADECDDACFPSGLPPNTTLSNCILSFTGLTPNTWYVIAIQIEDFINTTSTIPMSSVPVQFLVYVMANVSCTQIPIILPSTNCSEVQVGLPLHLTLYVFNGCNRTTSTITDIVDIATINGLQLSNITNSTTNQSLSYVTLNWTPQINQIGSQQFCALAYTNQKIQSDVYCVTFIVKNQSSSCQIITTESTTSTTTSVTSAVITTNFSITTSTRLTTTTMTTTSVTLLTTTSITSTTQETTLPLDPGSAQMNIPMIVGLLLLCLLLTLCCVCCCLFYVLWKPSGRYRSRNKRYRSKEQTKAKNKYTLHRSTPDKLTATSDHSTATVYSINKLYR